MSYRDILRPQLVLDEGCRSKPYRCTAGKLSIAVGRNLEDKGLRDDEIALMLVNDINDAEADAKALIPSFEGLSDVRKAVAVNMAFQLGRARLSLFKRFLEAIEQGNFELAAVEMLDSAWANQTPNRAKRLAKEMRQG